jgi:hypothetical protein
VADTYYKLSGTPNRHTDWTSEIVLERDEDGNVTKAVSSTQPATLNESEREKVESLGYSLEKVSKSEAEAAQQSGVGADVVGAAPVFGDQEAPNQAAATPAEDDKKK